MQMSQAQLGTLPDLTGLSPETIMQISNAGSANAKMFGDMMRGVYNDRLNEATLYQKQQQNNALNEYRSYLLSLQREQSGLIRQKNALTAKAAAAKSYWEQQKLIAQIKEIDSKIAHNKMLDKQIQGKLDAYARMRSAPNPWQLNPGDLAETGTSPVQVKPVDVQAAYDEARALLYGANRDDKGNITSFEDVIREDLSPSEIAGVNAYLEQAGMNLGKLTLPKTIQKDADGNTITYPARHLYFIDPGKGLKFNTVDETLSFLEQIREKNGLDEDDPQWLETKKEYLKEMTQ